MIILGLKALLHDNSAAIIKDGKIIAASSEERFDRIKHSHNFPLNAIHFCLQQAGLTNINQVDEIAIGMDYVKRAYHRFFVRFFYDFPNSCKIATKEMLLDINRTIEIKRILRGLRYRGRIKFLDHHDCHAMTSFIASPFDEAAILTVDGSGEQASTRIYYGKGTKLNKLLQINSPNSLGRFYEVVTQYLGFGKCGNEGKLMGLSSYGTNRFYQKMQLVLRILPGATYKLDFSYFDFLKSPDLHVSKKFISVFGPPRKKNEPIIQRHADIAKATQLVLEDAMMELVRLTKKLTNQDQFCMGGGVILNSVANGTIVMSKIFKKIYLYPAAGDDGISIGAAFKSYYAHHDRRTYFQENQSAYLGYKTNTEEIEKALNRYTLSYKKSPNIFKETAHLLSQNKFIGWFSGKAEFGPRALGNRSILANPRFVQNRDFINKKIKFRESFRPLAPSILEEFTDEYFETAGTTSPYMLYTFAVRPDKKKVIPAVTHVDGSARIHTVNKQQNKPYWQLLYEFYKITGVPVLLNTSFNGKDEPIVNTPDEAIHTLLNSNLDVLILENFIIIKKN